MAAVLLVAPAGLLGAPRAAAGPAAFGAAVSLPSSIYGFMWSSAPVGAPFCAGPQLAYSGQEAQGLGFGWVPVTPAPVWPQYEAILSPRGAVNLYDLPTIQVAAVGNEFVYAWQAASGYLTLAVRYANGSWGPITPVTPQGLGMPFDLAAVGSSLFLAWIDSSPPNGTVRVAQVAPSNGTLSSATVVDADATHVKADLAMAAAGGGLDVVWRRSNINGTEAFFARVTPGGPAPVPVQVTPGLAATRQFGPVVAAFPNGTALVTMYDYDGGAVPRLPAAYIAPPFTAFGPAFDLGARVGGLFPDHPELLTDSSGSLHLAWLNAVPMDNGTGNATYFADVHVMYAESDDGGLTFSTPVRVDNDASVISKVLSPFILGTNGDLFLGWSGGSSSISMIARGLVPGVHAAFAITPSVVFANESVSFDGSASAAGGTVSSYAWSFGDGGTSSGAQPSHAFAALGTYTVSLTVTDGAGDVRTTCLPVTVAADTVPPVVTASLAGATGADGWFRGPAILTLAATDTGSGVQVIRYRVNGGAWLNYTGPLTVSDGTYQVDFTAVDRAGNAASVSTILVRVDSTPPILQLNPVPASVTTGTVAVSWSGRDNLSGIAGYSVSVDDGARQSVGLNTSFTTTLPDGSHTITVWAVDGAGNNVSRSVTFRIDTNIFSPSGPYAGAPAYGIIVAVAAVGVGAYVLVRRRKPRQPLTPKSPDL